jgi:hypothetical protein
MKHLFLAIILFTFCAVASHGQTIKSLGFNATNGQVVANTGTNTLTFTNNTAFATLSSSQTASSSIFNLTLGQTNTGFGGVGAGPSDFGYYRSGSVVWYASSTNLTIVNGVDFGTTAAAAITRTNLGLGAANSVIFAGLTNNGDITINQTATNNGLLYIRRTNNEPFLGLANLLASNNTTISNETLFRVGTAEATNRSAQFGFRSTNTNGSGVAVFSVFGYNALAMIGPSARSATNTNGIEADIYSINPTNKVATLIDTDTGATLMHRPVGFTTNASTPSSTNTIVGWIELFVGTNSVRVPYYQ